MSKTRKNETEEHIPDIFRRDIKGWGEVREETMKGLREGLWKLKFSSPQDEISSKSSSAASSPPPEERSYKSTLDTSFPLPDELNMASTSTTLLDSPLSKRKPVEKVEKSKKSKKTQTLEDSPVLERREKILEYFERLETVILCQGDLEKKLMFEKNHLAKQQIFKEFFEKNISSQSSPDEEVNRENDELKLILEVLAKNKMPAFEEWKKAVFESDVGAIEGSSLYNFSIFNKEDFDDDFRIKQRNVEEKKPSTSAQYDESSSFESLGLRIKNRHLEQSFSTSVPYNESSSFKFSIFNKEEFGCDVRINERNLEQPSTSARYDEPSSSFISSDFNCELFGYDTARTKIRNPRQPSTSAQYHEPSSFKSSIFNQEEFGNDVRINERNLEQPSTSVQYNEPSSFNYTIFNKGELSYEGARINERNLEQLSKSAQYDESLSFNSSISNKEEFSYEEVRMKERNFEQPSTSAQYDEPLNHGFGETIPDSGVILDSRDRDDDDTFDWGDLFNHGFGDTIPDSGVILDSRDSDDDNFDDLFSFISNCPFPWDPTVEGYITPPEQTMADESMHDRRKNSDSEIIPERIEIINDNRDDNYEDDEYNEYIDEEILRQFDLRPKETKKIADKMTRNEETTCSLNQIDDQKQNESENLEYIEQEEKKEVEKSIVQIKDTERKESSREIYKVETEPVTPPDPTPETEVN